MELGDCDNSSLVATSGTCRISGCLAAEITRAPCWTKSWRPTLSDVFEVQTLFAILKNTVRGNTGHNTWMLCLMIRRKVQENMANLTFCPRDVSFIHSPFAQNTRRNRRRATLRNVSLSNTRRNRRRATLRNVSLSMDRCFYGKRSHFYGKWSKNPLVTLVFL